MIYELDKRQLLRLWSVLSSFGEIRETKDPIIQSEILRRAQLVLTDFVFGLKRVPEIKPVLPHSKAVAAKRRRSTPIGNGRTGQWRFRCPLKSEASLSSLFQLSGGRLRDIT
jgi:hypothetical protein